MVRGIVSCTNENEASMYVDNGTGKTEAPLKSTPLQY